MGWENENMNKDFLKGEIRSAGCSQQSGSDSGTEADTYAKTDLCMKIANYEQSCCLSKHTRSFPREDLQAVAVLLRP